MSISEEESNSRNFILNVEYGKIPSYSLWDSISVSKESNKEKIIWWSSFLDSKSIIVIMISKYWIKLLTNSN